MTWAAPIGADLARSLVLGLGADCSTAAALARAMAGRQGYAIDIHNLAGWPAAAIQRVTSDFVTRGWLSRTDTGWQIGPGQIPSGLVSFLDGAAAMRAIMPDEGMATTVVTMPPSPSAIGAALPATGLAYAALVPTKVTFERLADAAASSFTIMTPFLNDEGLVIALDLFRRTRARRRHLIIRRSGAARAAVDRGWNSPSSLECRRPELHVAGRRWLRDLPRKGSPSGSRPRLCWKRKYDRVRAAFDGTRNSYRRSRGARRRKYCQRR